MQITKTIMGHEFGIALSDVEPEGELANGANAYNARVAIYRDGTHIGEATWEPDGFAGGPDLFPEADASEDAYHELAAAVREVLNGAERQREWELAYPVAAGHLAELCEPDLGSAPKPGHVEPCQPWRVAGEARDLEVESVDGGEATLRVRSLSTGEWVTWGHAPVASMLTLPSWTFLGSEKPGDAGGLVLAL